MIEFIKTFKVLEVLLRNFHFGFAWTVLGIILLLITLLLSKEGRHVIIVKAAGITASLFFLIPGVIALIRAIARYH